MIWSEGAKYCINPIKAPEIPVNINPKIIKDAEDFIRNENAIINNNERIDPINEAVISNQGLFKKLSNPRIEKRKITTPTPKLDIDVTPKTDGSANGFLNNSCIKNPATGNAIPTNTLANDLGSRKFKIKF